MKNKCNFIFLLLILTSCSNNISTSTNNVSTSNNSSIISTSSSSVSIESCDNHFDCLTGIKLENINKIAYTYLSISSSWKVNEKYYTNFYNDINVEYQAIENLVFTDEMLTSGESPIYTPIFQITYSSQQEEKYINIIYYQNKIYFNYLEFVSYVSVNEIFLKEEYFLDGCEGSDWKGLVP